MILTVVNMIFLRWSKYLIHFETMYNSILGDIKQFFCLLQNYIGNYIRRISLSEWNDSHFYTFQFDNKVVNQ